MENSDADRAEYVSSMGMGGYLYYGDIVFDPMVEPQGHSRYVQKAKIKKYKERGVKD